MMIVDSQRFVVAAGAPPSYVDFALTTSGVSPKAFALPAGVQEGDLVFVVVAMLNPGSMGVGGGDGGWTYLVGGSGVVNRMAYKFVTAADIAASLTLATSGGYLRVLAVAYRGVGGVTLKGSGKNSSATPFSVAGWTPAAVGMVVSVLLGDNTPAGSVALTPPAGFIERVDSYEASDTLVVVGVADDDGYTGAAVEWAFTASPALVRNGQFVFELTP